MTEEDAREFLVGLSKGRTQRMSEAEAIRAIRWAEKVEMESSLFNMIMDGHIDAFFPKDGDIEVRLSADGLKEAKRLQ